RLRSLRQAGRSSLQCCRIAYGHLVAEFHQADGERREDVIEKHPQREMDARQGDKVEFHGCPPAFACFFAFAKLSAKPQAAMIQRAFFSVSSRISDNPSRSAAAIRYTPVQ